jgi:hypothetical protein
MFSDPEELDTVVKWRMVVKEEVEQVEVLIILQFRSPAGWPLRWLGAKERETPQNGGFAQRPRKMQIELAVEQGAPC